MNEKRKVRFADSAFRSSLSCKKGYFGDCVLVARQKGAVGVRDSKDRSKATLVFTKSEWRAFVKGVKNGEFNV